MAAEKRVALVIGNAVYKYADTLRNPANDAKAIGTALTRLGFTGTKPRLNLDYNGLRQALQNFSAEADGADMAVLYFAGHGVEVDGRNFLIPVDAKLERSKSVDFETASLDQALNAVEGARQLRLIILDACRNNPFRARMLRSGGARSIGPGLRSIEPGGNVLVAYAAKHGTFALDGKGGNSPFAEALKEHIEKPGLEIGQLFREVRDDVLERTGREQEPHLYGSLGREAIYLKPPQPVGDDIDLRPPPVRSESAETSQSWLRPLLMASIAGLGAASVAIVVLKLMEPAASDCTAATWGEFKGSKRLDILQDFMADCHSSNFGRLAEEELEKRDSSEWDEARKTHGLDRYRAYLTRWENLRPYNGRFIDDAKRAIQELSKQTAPSDYQSVASTEVPLENSGLESAQHKKNTTLPSSGLLPNSTAPVDLVKQIEEYFYNRKYSPFPFEATLQRNINLRNGPDDVSTSAAHLAAGTRISVVGEVGDDWYQANFEGVEGFILRSAVGCGGKDEWAAPGPPSQGKPSPSDFVKQLNDCLRIGIGCGGKAERAAPQPWSEGEPLE